MAGKAINEHPHQNPDPYSDIKRSPIDPLDWFLLNEVVLPGVLSGNHVVECPACGLAVSHHSELRQVTCCPFCGFRWQVDA
jgi:hypothetical protein